MPGCSKSPDTSKSYTAAQEPDAASKTKAPPIQPGKTRQETAVGNKTEGSPIQPGKARQETAVGNKTEGSPKKLTVDLGHRVKLEMVLIPAGEFLMGSPESDKDATPEEKPQHRVRITKPFYLGKYLVTQEQWEAVMGGNPSLFKGPKNPVEQVSWDDCQVFLGKLNENFGAGRGNFHLPTEAQWEYACRAGSKTRYCFGDKESGLGEYAWYGKNSGGQSHPVGEKKPNAWGLYDMHGNVWEWCHDWHDIRYYANAPMDDPMGPATGSNRVLRGGSFNPGPAWADWAWYCRSAFRNSDEPGLRSGVLGLRVCLVPADK
jgi:formylglycine-generating enzyme required for sulfatase activity